MFLRFQRIALDVSYGFGRNRSMFLIVVFLIKKSVYYRSERGLKHETSYIISGSIVHEVAFHQL